MEGNDNGLFALGWRKAKQGFDQGAGCLHQRQARPRPWADRQAHVPGDRHALYEHGRPRDGRYLDGAQWEGKTVKPEDQPIFNALSEARINGSIKGNDMANGFVVTKDDWEHMTPAQR